MSSKNETYIVVKQYLGVQILAVLRFCQTLGPIRTIFLLLLFAVVFVNIFFALPPYLLLVAYSVMIGVYNAKKRDRDFLKITIGEKYRICYWALYSVMALPFSVMSAVTANWWMIAFYPLSAAVVAFSPSLNKSVNLRLSHPLLTKDAYEYLSGFRFSSLLYVGLLVFSVLGACNGNVQIPKVVSLVVIYVLNAFYMLDYRCEYILNYPNARAIFIFKMKNILINNAVCLFPFLVLILGFSFSMHSLYTCAILYVVSVVSMMGTLSFRILLEKTGLVELLLVTLLCMIALLTVRYPVALVIYAVVASLLLFTAYYKVKKITRV